MIPSPPPLALWLVLIVASCLYQTKVTMLWSSVCNNYAITQQFFKILCFFLNEKDFGRKLTRDKSQAEWVPYLSNPVCILHLLCYNHFRLTSCIVTMVYFMLFCVWIVRLNRKWWENFVKFALTGYETNKTLKMIVFILPTTE